MKRSIVYSLVAGLLLAAAAAPAQAQEESPPLTVEVESIHVPATIGKLVRTQGPRPGAPVVSSKTGSEEFAPEQSFLQGHRRP